MTAATTHRPVPADAVLSLLYMPARIRPNQRDRYFDTRCPDIDHHDRVCGVTGYEMRPCCQKGYRSCFFRRSYMAQLARKLEMEA